MKLNTRVSLYGTIKTKNEHKITEVTEGKIKDLWVEIIPTLGNIKSIPQTEVETVEQYQTIKCRILEIKKPNISMYFMDANGWKYEIISFMPHYKNRDMWEFKTRIIYE